ncbi:MAG: hypothetical protein IJS74_02360 [Clostridia bacterium]|nr:hypothetical protein [Clostridia bacterium]
MTTLELLIIISVAVIAVFSLLTIFFRKRKKTAPADKKTETEKKVEPVYKKDEKKEDNKGDEKKDAETEQKTEGKKPEEKEGFKIIRKQSKVKINKKALTSGSRNPSVTRVFGKDVLKETEEAKSKEKVIDVKEDITKEVKPIERFGVKEYEYSETNTPEEFKINAPQGSPQRSFKLQHREFGPHLTVSEDGNLSGVVGVGIKKSIESATSQVKEIEKKNEDLIRRAQGAINLNQDDDDDLDFFQRRMMEMNFDIHQGSQPKDAKELLKNIDTKTLIVAEAIANPKYKNVNNNNGAEGQSN